jgi:protein-S-isoprenylcysteine O-methyltransferase Ste14
MKRHISLLYGLVASLAAGVAVASLIAFAGGALPSAFGDPAAPSLAALIDLCLLALFGALHTAMAREGFKRRLGHHVPAPLQRSSYTLLSSAALLLLIWQWRPIAGIVWDAGGLLAALLWGGFWAGWALALASALASDLPDLLGLRQAVRHWRGFSSAPLPFSTPVLYRWARHPMMIGAAAALGCNPRMSWGQLLFALGIGAYVLLALRFEKLDLLQFFGDARHAYRERVRAPRRTAPVWVEPVGVAFGRNEYPWSGRASRLEGGSRD